MDQTRNPDALRGRPGFGDEGETAPDALRLDKITETLTGMRIGRNGSDIGDANFGVLDGPVAGRSGNTLENHEWADSSRESINAMLITMSNSGREPLVSEYGWSEDREIQPRPNKAVIFAGILIGVITIGIAGYGFYSLGQQEATLVAPEITVVKKTPESAGSDEGGIRIASAMDKDLSRIADGENAHTTPITEPEGDTAPIMADSAFSLKTDRLPKAGTGEILSDSVQAERAAAKPVAEPVTAFVLPPEVKSAAEGAPAAAGGAPAAADKVSVAPDGVPVVQGEGSESLDSLTKSVVLAIVALGGKSDGGTLMNDPAGVLRVRMTGLIAAAARQGKPLSDVQLMLENALTGLPVGAIPDLLKDANGKVNVTMLLSAITPAADKRR